MTQLQATIEQVQPSFWEFLPVAQEPQHHTVEIFKQVQTFFSCYSCAWDSEADICNYSLPKATTTENKKQHKKFENKTTVSKTVVLQ